MPDAVSAASAAYLASEASQSADEPVAAAEPESAGEPAAETQGAVEDGQDVAAEAEDRTYTRGEYQKAVNEARNLRDRVRQYDDMFGGFASEDRQVLETFIQQVASSPADAAALARQIADALAPVEEVSATPEMTEQEARYMTPEEFDRRWQEKEQQRQVAQAQQQVEKEITDLGYKPDSVEYLEVTWLAVNQTGGDIAAAHRLMEDRKQDVIKSYLEGKEKQSKVADTASEVASTPSQGAEIKSLSQARAGVWEMMSNIGK